MSIGTLNTRWSQALIAGFVLSGCTEAVISPGSRSTPLALAMLRQAGLRSHIVIDERCAAFFALGISRAQRKPVLLLATSGTAPANWYPALIEASQSGLPLIALSADRPPELQGWGANQTVEQINFFGAHVRASHALGAPSPEVPANYLHRLAAQAVVQSQWPDPGPVHLNLPFREPLLPETPCPLPPPVQPAIWQAPLPLKPIPETAQALAQAISGRSGIIVCGEQPVNHDFATAVSALAEALNCPILAEPLSNLRFGPHPRHRLCTNYAKWLSDTEASSKHSPEWVLRFGPWPVTRALQSFLTQAPIQARVDPRPRWSDPTHQLTHHLSADPTLTCQALLAAHPEPVPSDWCANFFAADRRAAQQESTWHIPLVLDAAPADSHLFIGNSLAIRQLDSCGTQGDKPLHFHCNRGASGIDGNISTALGIAAVHGRVLALLGDLTCQHDLGGLAQAPGRDAVFVVVNNHGGGIFDFLPQHQLPEFEMGWKTPQAIRFDHAAATFGLGYRCATTPDSLALALHETIAAGGPHLIEVRMA